MGFEVKPQAATRCVHLSTEVTPVQIFLGIQKLIIIEHSVKNGLPRLTCMAFHRCGS